MFTGIIEEVGSVRSIDREGDALRLTVEASAILDDVSHGDSIAVNGVCLTVTDFSTSSESGASNPDNSSNSNNSSNTGFFTADVMQVTLDYTTIGELQPGDPVNLERAMAAGGRFGGHIVQGHVDGFATVVSRTPSEHWEVFRFTLTDPALRRYVVKKGSIAINGTSLTVSEMADAPEPSAGALSQQSSREDWWFEVSLIPTTLADTMLATLSPGDRVNIECDVIAKYLDRLHPQT